MIALFSNCHSDDSVWMIYPETRCTSAWGTEEDDKNGIVTDAVEAYFSEKDLHILEIETYYNSAYEQACKACGCSTGRVIRINVNEWDWYYFKLENFQIERN